MALSDLLKPSDRRLLREVTRKVHLRFYPKERLTDVECDKFIDAMGPQVIERQLRWLSDAGER